jgi:hypothetical protein
MVKCLFCGVAMEYNKYSFAICEHFRCRIFYYDYNIYYYDKCSKYHFEFIYKNRCYLLDNGNLKILWQEHDYDRYPKPSFFQKRSIEKGVYNLEGLKELLDNIEQYDIKDYLDDYIDYDMLKR